MTMPASTANYPYVLGHSHSLDDITGYRVIETITADGTRVWNLLDASASYIDALAVARAHRVGRAWARVVPIYSCGCSEDYDPPAVTA